MMKRKLKPSDATVKGSFEALRRAAREARKLSEMTGTPFYVVKNGKIVDLNSKRKPKRKAS